MSQQNVLTIAYVNMHGQSGMSDSKQVQLEDFIKFNRKDIAHLQEAEISDETFTACNFITSSFNLYTNNAENKYGTSSLVKSVYTVENLRQDTACRAIIFDIGQLTFGNLYAHSGSDAQSRASREKLFAEVIPQLLTNRKPLGCIGGDLNCIIDKIDATHHQDSKISNSLKRITNLFNMKDSFRVLHPKVKAFSRYYSNTRGQGATRIDRQYHYGNLTIKEAKYLPLVFSDHYSLAITICLPDPLSRMFYPNSRPEFKLRDEVIQDTVFHEYLAQAMIEWKNIKDYGMDTLHWWEVVVKVGIKKLGMQRGREMARNNRAELNLLLVRQAYLNKKVKAGHLGFLVQLHNIHSQIIGWYEKQCEKIKTHSRKNEFQQSEKVTIYHHELHKKLVRKSSILKLQTPTGIIEGHDACAQYLENEVKNLLLSDANLETSAQNILLDEVVTCFTEADNEILRAPPTIKQIRDTINLSNLHAAPGCDGIPSLLYKVCWDILGDSLVEVMQQIFLGKPLTPSQRTSLMVFGTKPKKPNSILPQDKRRISLLNSDFKIASGLEAGRLKKMLTHTLSSQQLVAGEDRQIHHGINLARDAIWAATQRNQGCGILDTDLIAGFDYMTLSWCIKVLERKGACHEFTRRLKNLYDDNLSVVVVNNIRGSAVKNIRLTLRQGDIPSMDLFCYGIDPLLLRLERLLQGILIAGIPVHGPTLRGMPPLPRLEQRFKVFGYADDTKPAIVSKQEFITVDKSLALFEKASGCKVHRDPENKKCKFLPLGSWRKSLKQTDIPCEYMTLSDHLDMVGVTLMATWTKTRKENGDILQSKVRKTIMPWKSGKFLPLTQRSWSLNCYALSKVWFRSKCIDLRVTDLSSITSSCKSWLYQDLLIKPEEMVLHRPPEYGGLGLQSVKMKAMAGFISTFLQTAANPIFQPNLLHNLIYRKYVLLEDISDLPNQLPPYFSQDLFTIIRRIKNKSTINIIRLSEKDWTRMLTEDQITMADEDNQDISRYIPCRVELASPDVNWELSWHLCRQPGMPPHLASFMWKLLHDLLCTQERLHRVGSSPSSSCKLCKDVTGTQVHELILCHHNDSLGTNLLSTIQSYIPT